MDTTALGLAVVAIDPLRADIAASLSTDIAAVETVWRTLTAAGIESPGQSYDFIRLWIEDRGIPAEDQRFVVGTVDGRPVALLPLHRKTVRGIPVFTWFPGAHAGCYAPVADFKTLAALGPVGRGALWRAMVGQLCGADLIYLRSMPTEIDGATGLFDELGSTLAVETLYRSQYGSWEECDRLQRSKSRRKHDRQQGDRLAAMGEVGFEEIRNGGDMRCAIETMFIQRAARFKVMGIRDPFVHDRLTDFYHAMAAAGSGVDVRLHVLRLDGAIVAVRYNVVDNDRMFCLISSMSDDPAIQNGSPGKQCLLRVMQSVFDQGMRVFDMGSGFTDEKRHWCNVQMPLRQHYIGLTGRGAVIVGVHQTFQKMRAHIKANKQLKVLARNVQSFVYRLAGKRAAEAPEKSD
ncbi:GNAT family N-acetyltransferase [Devosia yakushimensis]|uniref:GNAT family N-acetyltransferase n=1 Tax=Devosia yakushimensis TaxID=470028 RepID=UPI0024E0D957|nr:GNAT family N-acetyltransferase [Devosia yakushimensis]